MSADDKRREVRYKARLPVKVIRTREIQSLLTEDVSFRGVFLRMDAPPSLRQLVRLEIVLPEGATLHVHAMVVYRVAPGKDQAPGAGMQFYGLEGRERAQWDAFVKRVRDETPISAPYPVVLAPPDSPDAVRRKHERYAVRFEVRVSTVDELVSLYTRDISRGGMALDTDLDLELGTEVGLDLVHPQTTEMFELDAIVRRRIRLPGARGLAVEFTEMSEERRESLAAFIGPLLPKEEIVTVNEGDPHLA